MPKKIILALTLPLIASCASKNNGLDSEFDSFFLDENSANELQDPLEPLNRAIFDFNYAVDQILLKPVATIYDGVVPEYGQERVSNVLSNLGEPINMINGVFQGDPEQTFTSLWRFIINSTFGLAGIFDAATEVGLVNRKEDFGQTLGTYGMDHGFYIVLPILGSSSMRDLTGTVTDTLLDPFTYTLHQDARMTRTIVGGVDKRASLLGTLDDIYENSVDPYAVIRSAYEQNRASSVKND